MGLAVILISLGKGNTASILSYLFGSIIAVTEMDLYIIISVGLLVIISTTLLYKLYFIFPLMKKVLLYWYPSQHNQYLFHSFDSCYAAASMSCGYIACVLLMTIPVATALQLAGSFSAA